MADGLYNSERPLPADGLKPATVVPAFDPRKYFLNVLYLSKSRIINET